MVFNYSDKTEKPSPILAHHSTSDYYKSQTPSINTKTGSFRFVGFYYWISHAALIVVQYYNELAEVQKFHKCTCTYDLFIFSIISINSQIFYRLERQTSA